ncbi:2943_t:CDS:1, partial [Cetraspora pellucida]
GLISADRSTKTTLLLTIPSSKFKSSAKDLSTPIFEITIQGYIESKFPITRQNPNDMI